LGGIIGLIITLVIVFFVVRPALDNTNEQVDRSLDIVEQQVDESNAQIDESQAQLDQELEQADKALDKANGGGAAVDSAQKQLDCVQAAGTDVEALAACGGP